MSDTKCITANKRRTMLLQILKREKERSKDRLRGGRGRSSGFGSTELWGRLWGDEMSLSPDKRIW
jgi:hypothetical protein